MRINQMVSSHQQRFLQQHLSQSNRSESTMVSPGLAAAKRSNQLRLDEAAKGFVQAGAVRDGIGAVSKSVNTASSLIDKAKSTTLSADDRAALQVDFAKALSAATKAANDQRSALTDKTIANTSYDSARAKTVSPDQLGKGVSTQFNSVSALSSLDLRTASASQLAEAGKVLDAAKRQVVAPLARANADSGRQAGLVNRYDSVQQTISPKTGGQQSSLLPGSLFNTSG